MPAGIWYRRNDLWSEYVFILIGLRLGIHVTSTHFVFTWRIGTLAGAFLLHDAMHSADYAVARCPSVCQSVYLSVRLSVTRQYSVETTKHILKLSLSSSSHTILVFFLPNSMAIFRREPHNIRMQGMKNRDFRPITHLVSEIIQHRAVVTVEGEQETVPKLSNGKNFDDRKWPLTQISRSRHYLTLNISETIRQRDTDTVTMKY